ncbi:SDR family NAD(P)-dependent oxidoreductase [Nocardia sp. NPDC051570]|uniref:SDR family NAD(P)-dependent oxidoreductase n=1 Tax=Nocardia sp. NPDC051570 TaxID=3364324 RepID=UPI0037A93EBD
MKPALERAATHGRAGFMVVTQFDGTFGLTSVDTDENAILGGVFALVKTLGIEAPTLFCRSIDLASGQDPARLLAELYDPRTDLTQIGYDSTGVRRTIEFTEDRSGPLLDDPEVAQPNSEDLLVFTGGGRGVTAACAIEAAARYRCGMLLLGRTELADEPDWCAGVPDDKLIAAIAARRQSEGQPTPPRELRAIAGTLVARREVRATLARLRELGTTVDYLAVDVTDPHAVRTALAPYRDRITGIVHGAGVLADQLVDQLTPEAISTVLTPKLDGWFALVDAVDTGRLRHAVIFGSVVAIYGNRGQASYSVANEALNHLACALKLRHPGIAVTSINWSAWSGGMVGPELERMMIGRGITPIPPADGAVMFADQLAAPRSRDLLCQIGPWRPMSEPVAVVPGREVRMSRDMGQIAQSRAMGDHMIDGKPVLPAGVALGMILDVVAQTHPHLDIRSAYDFKVFKGVILDATTPRLHFTIRDTGPDEVSVTVTDDSDRPRYRGLVSSALAESIGPDHYPDLPTLAVGAAVPWYDDRALFHGPSMRGLHTVLEDGDRFVVYAQLPEPDWAVGYCGTSRYRALTSDVLMQAAGIRCRNTTGLLSLPAGIAAAELLGPLPDAEPFYVVVSRVTVAEPRAYCTIEACDPTGRVLLRLRDAEMISSAGLDERFGLVGRHADA